MINLRNIYPLSDFQRSAKAHIGRIKRSGEPTILTVNGQAEIVVLSARAYEQLLAELQLAQSLHTMDGSLLEMFRSGQMTADELAGHLRPHPEAATIPAEEAFTELDRRIHQRRKKKAS